MPNPQAATTDLGALLQRIRAEFQEMPGLRLTEPQACRLWRLDPTQCQEVLEELVITRFLVRTRDGSFVRS